MDIPEMFLLAEAVLIGLDNVTDGLVVYPARIRSRFLDELPFMVTEAVRVHVSDSGNFSLIFPQIIMKLVAKGASRQEYVATYPSL